MGYIESHLTPGEAVLYRARLHPIIFLIPLLVLQAGVPVLLLMHERQPGLLLLALAAVLAIEPAARYLSCEFAVTDRRVVAKYGILRRRSVEILLTKVQAVQIDQTYLGRLLGFGMVIVTGTGGTPDRFIGISRPGTFLVEITKLTPGP